MFPAKYYSNNTICILSDDRQAIREATTNLLIKEGGKPIRQLPSSAEQINIYDYWIIALFPGNNGWTIIKTFCNGVLCDLTADGKRPRLSALAMQLQSDAFYFGVYSGISGMLIEANSAGEVYVSGTCDSQVEIDTYFGQPIDRPDLVKNFSLLEVPESLKSAIQINQAPETIRIQEEYEIMASQEYYWREGSKQKNRLWEDAMKGYSHRIDESFAAVIDDSGIWEIENLLYVIYQDSERFIKTDDCLICFKTPSNYIPPSEYELTPEQWTYICGELPPHLK